MKFDFLYPIISVIIGLFFAQTISQIILVPLIILLSFIYSNVFLKNYWVTQDKIQFNRKYPVLIPLVITALTIFYFSVSYSMLALPILIILSLFIQSKSLFKHFQLDNLFTFMYYYIFVIIFNILSFYFQLRYLSSTALLSIVTVTSITLLLIYLLIQFFSNKKKA